MKISNILHLFAIAVVCFALCSCASHSNVQVSAGDDSTRILQQEPKKPSPVQTSLTATQAQTLATQLANDKADSLFHRRPFHDSRPAEFAEGRWIWTASQGWGLSDFNAKVELAADGSTNSVDVQLFNDVLIR